MTERARYRPRQKGMVVSLNLRVTTLTVRDLVTRQCHKLHVPGAPPLSWDGQGGTRLALPLALDSLLLPRYNAFPLSADHLFSMTIIPAQEGLGCTDCYCPPP